MGKTTNPKVTIKEGGMSCVANVPFLYSTTTNIETCEAPTMDYARYEYGSCNYYTRNGFIDLAASGAFNYQVQELSNSTWYTIHDGPQAGLLYSKTPGTKDKTFNLRVRAKTNHGLTSWYTFNARVPACWNGGGVDPR